MIYCELHQSIQNASRLILTEGRWKNATVYLIVTVRKPQLAEQFFFNLCPGFVPISTVLDVERLMLPHSSCFLLLLCHKMVMLQDF